MMGKILFIMRRWIQKRISNYQLGLARQIVSPCRKCGSRLIEHDCDIVLSKKNKHLQNKNKIKQSMKYLEREIDPMENMEEIPPDSIQTIKSNISTISQNQLCKRK